MDVVPMLDGRDGNVAVASGSGACGPQDVAHDAVDLIVVHDHFDFQFVDVILRDEEPRKASPDASPDRD